MRQSSQEITAYVLAGGKSSRMSQDKGNVLLHGKPMILHITECLEKLFSEACIVGGGETYGSYGFRCIQETERYLGPGMGILRALEDCKTAKALICSCDMPFIPSALIKHLISEIKDEDILIPSNNEVWQPFPAILSSCISSHWEEIMKEGNMSLKYLFNAFRVKEVDLQHAEYLRPYTFMNVNSPLDLAQAEEIKNYD